MKGKKIYKILAAGLLALGCWMYMDVRRDLYAADSNVQITTWNPGQTKATIPLSLTNSGNNYKYNFFEGRPVPNGAVKARVVFMKQNADGSFPDANWNVISDGNGTITSDNWDTLDQQSNVFKAESTGFDTTKPYIAANGKPACVIGSQEEATGICVWDTQGLSVNWPQEDGVYKTIFRYYDSEYEQYLISSSLDGTTCTVMDCAVWDIARVNSNVAVVGQDSSAPVVEVQIKDKDADDSAYQELKDGVVNAGQKIKIHANGDIIGLKDVKYKWVDAASSSTEWKSVSDLTQDTILEVPDNFKGKLMIEASDQMETAWDSNANPTDYRKTSLEYSLTTNTGEILIGLPSSMSAWEEINAIPLYVYTPVGKTLSYLEMKYTLDGHDYIETIDPSSLVNNHYDITTLRNGAYTLHITAVADQGDGSGEITNTAETYLMIDNKAEISVDDSAPLSMDGSRTLKIAAETGPSEINSVMLKVEKDNGEVYEERIPTSGNSMEELQYVVKTKGLYTFTLQNKAGKKVSAETRQSDITYAGYDLNIDAKDPEGNSIASGQEAKGPITITVTDRNHNGDIYVCMPSSTCSKYTGPFEVTDSKTITFKDAVNGNDIGSFTVNIKSESQDALGTLVISDKSSYSDPDKWYQTSQQIRAEIVNGTNSYLEYKDSKTQNFIPLNKQQYTFSITPSAGKDFIKETLTVRIANSKGEHSEEQTVYVNVDTKKPVISLDKVNKDGYVHVIMAVDPGESGVDRITVDGTVIMNAVTNGYDITKNGNYTFILTNRAGRSSDSVTLTVDSIEEGTMVVKAKSNGSLYDGSWTKDAVSYELEGGLLSGKTLDHYEVSETPNDTASWKTISNPYTVDEEVNKNLYFRAVDTTGAAGKISNVYTVRIDRGAPEIINITLEPVNQSTLANMLSRISFDSFFKETLKGTILAQDMRSDTAIYYQISDTELAQGDERLMTTSSAWKPYHSSLTFDKDANIIIYAYAKDEAGNISNVKNSDGVVLDMTKPILYGLDGDSGYIKRKVTYEDVLSGLKAVNTYIYNDQMMDMSQGMMVEEAGNYHFIVEDLAGNILEKDFVLKAFPSADDMDGSDGAQDIIDEIQKELDDQKGNLDDDTIKDYEDKIDELIHAQNANRVKELKDETSGAVLSGLEDTTFPKNAVLKVEKITSQKNEQDIVNLNQLIQDKIIQDLYKVSILLDDQEINLTGTALISIPLESDILQREELELRQLKDGTMQKISNHVEGSLMKATIESTGDFALLYQTSDRNNSNINTGDPVYGAYTGDRTDRLLLEGLLVLTLGTLVLSLYQLRRRRN